MSTTCQQCGVSSGSRSMGPFPGSLAPEWTRAGGYCLGSTVNRASSQCISDLYKLHTTRWHLSAGLRGEDKGNLTTHARTFTCLKANAPKDDNKNTQSNRNLIRHSPQGFYPQRNSIQQTKNPCSSACKPSSLLLSTPFPHTHTFRHIHIHICTCTHLQMLAQASKTALYNPTASLPGQQATWSVTMWWALSRWSAFSLCN